MPTLRFSLSLRAAVIAALAVSGAHLAPAAAQSDVAYTSERYATLVLSFVPQPPDGETEEAWPLEGLSETTPSPRNPFLDFRLDVTIQSPSGKLHKRPGYYAADGVGGDSGIVWQARFTPTELGFHVVTAVLRHADDVNIDATVESEILMTQSFQCSIVETTADTGFRAHGPLEIVDGHYRHVGNGAVWHKHGMNSPENFLAYQGFDRTRDYGQRLPSGQWFTHKYGPHLPVNSARPSLWDAEELNADGSSATSDIGSVNIYYAMEYLASKDANSLYMLPMNMGGDGCDTHPFSGVLTNPNTTHTSGVPYPTQAEVLRYDVGRLRQWSMTLEYAQDLGLFLDLVLHEQEIGNIAFLGESADHWSLTKQRKLYFKQMVAYFGHLPGVRWILCEENGFATIGPQREFTAQELDAMALFLLQESDPEQSMIDISVHTPKQTAGTAPSTRGDLGRFGYNGIRPYDSLDQLPGGLPTWLTSLSLQIDDVANIPDHIEKAFRLYGNGVQRRPVHFDEIGPASVGANPSQVQAHRLQAMWDVLFSGAHFAWYAAGGQSEGDLSLENFAFRETHITWSAGMWSRINDSLAWGRGRDGDGEAFYVSTSTSPITYQFIDSSGAVSPTAPVRQDLLVGELALIGGADETQDAEVMYTELAGGSVDAYAIYFPRIAVQTAPPSAIVLGTLDMSGAALAPPGGAWVGRWYLPEAPEVPVSSMGPAPVSSFTILNSELSSSVDLGSLVNLFTPPNPFHSPPRPELSCS